MQPPPVAPPNYGSMIPPPKKGLGCWGWGAILAVAFLICGGGCVLLGKAAMDSPEFRKGFQEGMERSRAQREGRTVPTAPTNAPATE